MHPFKFTRRLMLGGLATVAGFHFMQAPPAVGQQPTKAGQTAKDAPPTGKPAQVRLGKSGELLIPLGGLVEFKPKLASGLRVKKREVSNDQIIQAKDGEGPDLTLLIGQNTGVARIVYTLSDDSRVEYEVVVQPDFEYLKKVIQKAVPTASIEVLPGIGNGIILTGYVNKPSDASIVEQIARSASGGTGTSSGAGAANIVNAIQVGGPQHVMIEVVVAQVNRSELRQRGSDFYINGTSGSFASLLSGFVSDTTASFTGLGQPRVSADANLRFGLVSPQFFSALRALRSENLSKILSEPKVTTQSGRPAIIRSGGQQAVLSATGGGLGSVSVQLEQIGTTLEVLPIVYGDGKIFLEIAPSIRARNDGLGIQTSAGFSPGFTEQSTRAAVVLESGQTFAIGGLLETTVQAVNSKVPYVGDLPYIGTAFSTIRYDEREQELIVLVTPRLVDALDCNQVPRRLPGRETRTPDDYELFLEGLIEAPRGQRQVWNGRCYNAAYKCDPTYGIFPARGNVCNGGNGSCASPTAVLTGCNTEAVPTSLPQTLSARPKVISAPVTLTPEPLPVLPVVNTVPEVYAVPAANTVPATNAVPLTLETPPTPVPAPAPAVVAPVEQIAVPKVESVAPVTPIVIPMLTQESRTLPPIEELKK